MSGACSVTFWATGCLQKVFAPFCLCQDGGAISRAAYSQELPAFLGLIIFKRRFLPAIAPLFCPLTDALKGNRRNPDMISWLEDVRATFLGPSMFQTRGNPSGPLRYRSITGSGGGHIKHPCGACLQQRCPPGFFGNPLGFSQIN